MLAAAVSLARPNRSSRSWISVALVELRELLALGRATAAGKGLVLVAISVALTAAGFARAQTWEEQERLLVAPMIGGLDACLIEPADRATEHDAHMKQDCRAPGGSAGARVEATLEEIGPLISPSSRYELGYTLNVPLLRLFRRDADQWRIDDELVRRFARTVKDADRPVVLYLFATHFSVHAPIEPALASDARNLAMTPLGPLGTDKYHGLDIYPWSVASTDNDITRRRREAIDAMVEELCRLPSRHHAKVKAVTLLGEVHQLYPDFESGMGFASRYLVSDYSAESKARFVSFLVDRFGSIDALNRYLGSSFLGFRQIDPPAKDIRKEPLKHFWEHIDSFAHGLLPVNGWAFLRGQSAPAWIRILLNGKQIARVAADLGRQDVAAAHPEFGTADVGWRFDLPFRDLPYGVHRIDVVAEADDGALLLLGSRRFAYVDRSQSAVKEVPSDPLTGVQPTDARIAASVDMPVDLTAVFFNPLVPLWHEFRAQQVASYLGSFARRLQGTCLTDAPTYVHQIAPFVNPSWDSTKYAVDASLRTIEGARLGISLYGEATYGRSFFDWYSENSGQIWYGITEFHPLRGMDADELQRTFDRHHAHGARFLSFFVDGQPRRPVGQAQSIFVDTTFNPDVRAFGSDRLFRAVQEIMRR